MPVIDSRPRPRRAWVGLLALFASAACVETLFWGQLNAFTPLHLLRLGVAPARLAWWTGVTSGAAVALGLPLLPLWGALADRYARQPLIVRSFAVYLVAATVSACAGRLWLFVLGRALMSLALGNSGLMMTVLAERAPERRVAFAFAVLNAAGPIGAFLGPLVGGPLVDRYGLPGLLALDGALLVVVTVALQLGFRDHFVGTSERPLLAMVRESLRDLWTSPAFALLPALFLLFSGWMLANTFAPIGIARLAGDGRAAATAVGLVLGAGGLATLVLAPLLGVLADRFGRWRVLLAGAVVEVALWLAPAHCHRLAVFAVAWALVNGVASGVFAIAFTILAASSSTAARGRVMAYAYLPVNLGALVGAAVGSLVAPTELPTIFPLAAALTAGGVGALVVAGARLPRGVSPLGERSCSRHAS